MVLKKKQLCRKDFLKMYTSLPISHLLNENGQKNATRATCYWPNNCQKLQFRTKFEFVLSTDRYNPNNGLSCMPSTTNRPIYVQCSCFMN